MGKLTRAAALALAITATVAPRAARAGELRGSPASMERQHQVAVQARYEFLGDSAHVQALVAEGGLEPIAGNGDFAVSRQVSFPYARPEVRELLERLAADFRSATGESLVVTSLIRVTRWQPRNAHKLSVHPAGMAFDLHVPSTPTARVWLERTLLWLEDQGVLDVTRERKPRHYHVAVFPDGYHAWAAANSSPYARRIVAPSALVAAVAAGARSAAYQSQHADAMLLMLPVVFGLAVYAAHRRQARAVVARHDASPRRE
jgi:hypothetical protein